ncbi:hypothetical protein RHMOL_Rhmol08G0098300 [Rhododendron molle]|uniref:Uncharacterized protein n=1 Tax=Rhododendron molle TaxID=49168 RepID=A0ACC0MMW3_RHOML|nr:hypothetical protein RHMOL_Rhmol08G0098300 [Rhododendron molle]
MVRRKQQQMSPTRRDVGAVEHPFFGTSSQVEVYGNDVMGLKGPWYVATIIEIDHSTPNSSSSAASTKKKRKTECSRKPLRYLVQYATVEDDEDDEMPKKPLREFLEGDYLRPLPPPTENQHAYELKDVVDAYHRDGWWPGVVVKVADGGSRFVVSFEDPPGEFEFSRSELRVHLDWVDCRWVWATGKDKREQASPKVINRSVGDCSSTKAAGDPSNFLTLTDPDLLDCPICFENLTIPVFQCSNGHLACSSCCIKGRNKCPSCSSTIGRNGCRPIEKIIESVKTSCQNQKYGCSEMVFFCKKRDHEDVCIYVPCSCPLTGCAFVGSSKNLALHLSTKHSGSAKCFCYDCSIPISLEIQQKSVILQEEHDGTVFILNNGVQNLGNVIDVICIAPSSSERGFPYDLLATNGGRSVKLQSFAEQVCGRVDHTPKSFLVVPSDFFGSRGHLKLELRISRLPGVVHA